MRSFVAALTVAAAAQQPATPAFDAGTRKQVIDGAIDHVRRAYVFADVADKMAEALRAHEAARAYEGIATPREFAETLTQHLQEVSRDKHLRIIYAPDGLRSAPLRRPPIVPDAGRGAAAQLGFQRVERLDGNVGYIELLGFSGSEEAEAAVPAMNFLANADALIFDLRRNGGGSPVTIGLLSSYLFDEVVHLNDFYIRETDTRRSSSPRPPWKAASSVRPNRCMLTSSRTFSAAEEFTQPEESEASDDRRGNDRWGRSSRRCSAHHRPVRHLAPQRACDQSDHEDQLGRRRHRARHQDPWARGVARRAPGGLKKIRETATDTRHREELDRAIAAVEKAAGPQL